MKKFLCRFFVFLAPFLCVAVVTVPFFYIGYTTGELRNFDSLMEKQRNDHSVYIGMGYNEQTGYYKIQNANYYQADIIALGTSRVMQFQADFFSDSFYNCGGAVDQNFREYTFFLTDLDYKPAVIILGLDSWVFNDAWNHNFPVLDLDMPVMLIERNKIVMLWDIIKDFVDHKWDWESVGRYPTHFGFNGRIRNSGFRWDGSYDYGDVYQELELQNDSRFQDTFERMNEGKSRFQWGEHADQETQGYLNEFLRYCKENGIEVVGFAPPFAPCVYERMTESGNYGYLSEIEPVCSELFEQYGYTYLDYTDGAVLGLDDTYFVDGFHGSEVVYALIMKDMADRGTSLGKYIDTEKLEDTLAKCSSSLVLYKDGSE